MSVLRPGHVPADDRGLLLGDGIFETIRLYGGRPFRLKAHIERLTGSARTLGFSIPADLTSPVAEALESWGDRDGALRITLTRGSGRGLLPPTESPGRLLVSIVPISRPPGVSHRGLNAVIRGRIDEHALTSGIKAIGYLERIQALRLAHLEGADEALLTNSRAALLEGSTSNLLAVRGDTLLAPGAAEGALPGITREVLLEAARQAGIPIEERGIQRAELAQVSEILLSSSIREVVPVVEVEGEPIGTGHPGPVFQELAARFREIVEADGR